MFRNMRRIRQQLSDAECIAILKNELRGVLSVLGDDDWPYGMPLNHWYCEADGVLYFHGGTSGHKIDAVTKHDKASFCVYDTGERRAGDWALHFRSVIVFGRVKIIADREKTLEICRQLSAKFTSDTAYIEDEIQQAGDAVLCFALIPEHITGKRVKES
ncbi:MAG: pyridoxamine 5'-phosphate oxidase family protein [Treponema sp.]|nr:pyridoxamine 5'-phosphate oxidase family protein [Treponema sp.]